MQPEHHAPALDDFCDEDAALNVTLKRAGVEHLLQLIASRKLEGERMLSDFVVESGFGKEVKRPVGVDRAMPLALAIARTDRPLTRCWTISSSLMVQT
jgi:hypothetical protein